MRPACDTASAVSQADAAPAAQRFKEIGDLNDFEKKLLEEVSSQRAVLSGKAGRDLPC
jgi:hypothetical protein